MDSRKVTQIRRHLDEALQIVRDEFKLELVVKTIRFDSTGFKVTLEATEKNEDGTNAKQVKDWKDAVQYKLVEEEWLGLVLKGGYKVIGYDFAKKKNTILLEREGKTYLTAPSAIRKEIQFRALTISQDGKE